MSLMLLIVAWVVLVTRVKVNKGFRMQLGKMKMNSPLSTEAGNFSWKHTIFKSILNISLIITLICTLVFTCSFLIISKSHNQKLTDVLTAQYAQEFEHKFSKETQAFSALIQDEILAAWSSGVPDDATVYLKTNRIKSRIPSIRSVSIITPDQQEPTAVQAGLGYAAIDMAHRVFHGDVVLPELHRVEEGGFYINHVVALKKTPQSEIFGVAVVSEDLAMVQSLINDFKGIPGYLELRETLLGQNRIIAKNDRIELAGTNLHSNLSIPGTSWQMSFWLDPNYAVSFSSGILPLIIGILLLVMACSCLILQDYRRLAKVLDADSRALSRMLQSIIDRTMPQAENLYLSSHQVLANYIQKMGVLPRNLNLMKSKDDPASTMDWGLISEVNTVISSTIFRAYDIRGIADETLTPGVMHLLGKSIGSEIVIKNNRPLIFGRDGRLSGEELSVAFCEGVRSTGVKVIDIGIVPTPLVYFGAYRMDTGNAVMLTGSHNPPEYNGLKIVIDKETLAQDKITALHDRIKLGQFETGEGDFEKKDLLFEYIAKVTRDIKLAKPLKVVVDAGNGVGGVLAVPLFKSLGCDVIEMFCDVDGTFPNHHPDPSQPSNLFALIEMVQTYHADIGIALDGDGDRLGVVTPQGEIIWPDRLMMLFAQDVLARHPGSPILYDVKCSKQLTQVIEAAGGKAVMCATGHSLVKRALKIEKGILAGEMSGHFFFCENWYGFDDACFAAAKLLAYLAAHPKQWTIDQIFENLPKSIATPEINISISDTEKFNFIEKLKAEHGLHTDNLITLDGLRAEFKSGWGLVRASNTTPNLVLRFEADTQAALEQIQADFKVALLKVDPELEIPF